jgi:hypothetical protein
MCVKLGHVAAARHLAEADRRTGGSAAVRTLEIRNVLEHCLTQNLQ